MNEIIVSELILNKIKRILMIKKIKEKMSSISFLDIYYNFFWAKKPTQSHIL